MRPGTTTGRRLSCQTRPGQTRPDHIRSKWVDAGQRDPNPHLSGLCAEESRKANEQRPRSADQSLLRLTPATRCLPCVAERLPGNVCGLEGREPAARDVGAGRLAAAAIRAAGNSVAGTDLYVGLRVVRCRGAHTLLDLASHRKESLFDVAGVLGRCL